MPFEKNIFSKKPNFSLKKFEKQQNLPQILWYFKILSRYSAQKAKINFKIIRFVNLKDFLLFIYNLALNNKKKKSKIFSILKENKVNFFLLFALIVIFFIEFSRKLKNFFFEKKRNSQKKNSALFEKCKG